MLSALLLHTIYCLGVFICVSGASLFVHSCKYWRQQKERPNKKTGVCLQNCLPFPFHLLLCGENERGRYRKRLAEIRQRPAVRHRTKSDDREKLREANWKSAAWQKMDRERQRGVQSCEKEIKRKEGEGKWRRSEREFSCLTAVRYISPANNNLVVNLKTNRGAIWG